MVSENGRILRDGPQSAQALSKTGKAASHLAALFVPEISSAYGRVRAAPLALRLARACRGREARPRVRPHSRSKSARYFGVGQFFAALYPACSASSTVLNLT
jgi:hypothetical protein